MRELKLKYNSFVRMHAHERANSSENIVLVTQFYRRIISTANPSRCDVQQYLRNVQVTSFISAVFAITNFSPNYGRIYCCKKGGGGEKNTSDENSQFRCNVARERVFVTISVN